MGMQEAVTSCFSKYVGFGGRAVRSEFWYWELFLLIAGIVLGVIDRLIFGGSVLGAIFQLAVLLPSLAVGVRRLHDVDKSGWWWLILFVPVIGIFVLLYFWVQPGTPGTNRFA